MTGEQRFKTGDSHPMHNLLAFVEYDEHGVEWWTSIGEDKMAPYRLAKHNEQLAISGNTPCPRKNANDIL